MTSRSTYNTHNADFRDLILPPTMGRPYHSKTHRICCLKKVLGGGTFKRRLGLPPGWISAEILGMGSPPHSLCLVCPLVCPPDALQHDIRTQQEGLHWKPECTPGLPCLQHHEPNKLLFYNHYLAPGILLQQQEMSESPSSVFKKERKMWNKFLQVLNTCR